MKLAVSTLSASREAGGLFESVRYSSQALHDVGIDVRLVALRDRFTREDLAKWGTIRPEIVDFAGPRQLLFAPGFKRALAQIQPDVMHTHGLWQPSSYAVLRHHRKSGVPYVVSPRGMLDPWALANSGWKKKLAGAAFENAHLREAACLHALCESEAEAMRGYGLRNPIAIVPNGAVLPEAKQRSFQFSVFSAQPENQTRTKTLLFLGRLHPKKGLLVALRAWAEVTRGMETGWRFVVAGWDQGGHEAELKRLCGELGLQHADIPADQLTENCKLNPEHFPVIFAGPAFDGVKESLLEMADAFILPSLSEGLPMSVLEAWAYGLPVLMTDECNLPEGFSAGAAVRIKSYKFEIAEGMSRVLAMPDEERMAMGRRGRELVERQFTWPKVARQIREVYEWILGGGARPEFVKQ